jgi:hypothetical protein
MKFAVSFVALCLIVLPLITKSPEEMPVASVKATPPTPRATAEKPVVPTHLERSEPEQDRSDMTLLADEVVTSPGLLSVARGRAFAKASKKERLRLVESWAKANMPKRFNALSDSERRELISSLEQMLQELVIELRFQAPSGKRKTR